MSGESPVIEVRLATPDDLGDVAELYVRRESRGLGIPAALIAEICRQVRAAGGEFIKGAAESEANAKWYESVAVGWPARAVSLGGQAFYAMDLAGPPPREIVRRLPDPQLCWQPPRPR